MPAARAPKKPAPERRREIADAALRVIATGGVGRFTAAAVAKEVGLTDGAVFRHFASMDAIVDAAIDRVEELLFDGVPPDAADPVERLGAFFRRRVAVIRANPGVSRLVATEALSSAGSAAAFERVLALRRRSRAFVLGCLDEAEHAGRLAPGLHAEEAGLVVLGALTALAHSASAPSVEDVGRLAPRVWDALERLLRGAPLEAAPRPRSPSHPPKGESR